MEVIKRATAGQGTLAASQCSRGTSQMAAAARQLSAAELAFYREHGFVRVDRLITAAQVAELSADYDAAIAEE